MFLLSLGLGFVGNKNRARDFSDRSFFKPPGVMDVRAFGLWMSAPTCLFFFLQDFEGLTEAFAPGRPPGYLRGRQRDIRPRDLIFGIWGLNPNLEISSTSNFRERPPGLIQLVLAVPVFWCWALLLPWLPLSSRSLRSFPWASILLHGPLDICSDVVPAAPLPPVQNGTHSEGHTPTVSRVPFDTSFIRKCPPFFNYYVINLEKLL